MNHDRAIKRVSPFDDDEQENGENALWIVDKPYEWTSFDVVAKVRNVCSRHFGKKSKVGHGGTLDPLATGVLLILTGKMTKTIPALEVLDKSYRARLCLGATTKSYDLETAVEQRDIAPSQYPTKEAIELVLSGFIGKSLQVPPMFSATWHKGKRLYELARAGKEVERTPKPIEIFQLDLVDYEWPRLVLETRVSKGTYIRTLAHDIGVALGVGAYLAELVRTRVGEFKLEEAHSVEMVCDMIRRCPKAIPGAE